MSFLTNAADLAIERDLRQFLDILLIALGAASLPKIFSEFWQTGHLKSPLPSIVPQVLQVNQSQVNQSTDSTG